MMKLIDLLVQELPKRGGWPEGAKFITQDGPSAYSGGNVVSTWGVLPELREYMKNREYWTAAGHNNGYGIKCFHDFELCQDYLSSIVARQEYEAALAASNQVEWDGEGLPPVGCECEFFNEDYECRESVPKNGTIVKVVAHQKSKSGIDCAVFTWHGERCDVHAEVCNEYLFRPIRNESERKREEAIKKMMDCSAVMVEATAGLIYDAIAAGEITGVKLDDI